MRVLVAPDKFAGTMSAGSAAQAVAHGWAAVRPDDEIRLLPMADGGAGSLDAILTGPCGARMESALVHDPLGRHLRARWLRLPSGVAFIEASEACGLSHLSVDERDPMRATSRGVGELVRAAAADIRVSRLVVGLGGTATVDGGLGALEALGFRFLDCDGVPVRTGGAGMVDVASIESPDAIPVPTMTLAVDVSHTLAEAAPVFGPQKGASAEEVRSLSKGLHHLADVVERVLPGGPWRDAPGTGAAGGLGFALRSFLGAEITQGAAIVADLVGLFQAIDWADLVITGEGALDSQSLAGKAPVFVADAAASAGRPVLAVAGRIEGEVRNRFADCAELGDQGLIEPTSAASAAAAALAEALHPGLAGSSARGC